MVGDEPVAVLLADDLFDSPDRSGIGQLMDAYAVCGGAGVVAVMEVPIGQEHKYGIVAGDSMGNGVLKVREMVEKPDPGTAPSRLAIIGRYVLPPEIWPALAETAPGHGGEIQLTDAMKQLVRDGPGLCAMEIRGTRYDAGDPLGFLHANIAYSLKNPELAEPLRKLLQKIVAESPSDQGAP